MLCTQHAMQPSITEIWKDRCRLAALSRISTKTELVLPTEVNNPTAFHEYHSKATRIILLTNGQCTNNTSTAQAGASILIHGGHSLCPVKKGTEERSTGVSFITLLYTLYSQTQLLFYELKIFVHSSGFICSDWCLYFQKTQNNWLRGTVVEHRSLVGELSLSCARTAADG